MEIFGQHNEGWKEEEGARGEPRVYMFESRQAEEETQVIPLSGPARQF